MLAAMGAAVLPGSAYAQSSVTLYGIIDTGVEFVNHIGTANSTVMRVPSITGSMPSRWGFRGTEDMGGGLKTVFVLESGFAPNSGTAGQGGRIFGRQAFVGLANQWGQLSIGRQWNMLFWGTLDSDILGPNVYGAGSLDNYLPNARDDNSIAYKGSFNGLSVGMTYSFGRDAVNAGPSPSGTNCPGQNPADSRACREWSAMLQYSTGQWGVAAVYDSQRGGPGAFAGLTNSSLTDNRLSLSGYAVFGNAKVGLGLIHRNNDGSTTPRSNLWYGGLSYNLTPAITLAGQVYYINFSNSPNNAIMYAVRGSYAFSKRTSTYITAGYIQNRGTLAYSVSGGDTGSSPIPGGSQLGTMIGMKHTF
ncbi:porin [Pandoraea sp. NPDC087047]|uniref:porin n=1 Tax=Pandoraea sp. NPDC087047 TaxID=3364390 RepID=UPI0038103571